MPAIYFYIYIGDVILGKIIMKILSLITMARKTAFNPVAKKALTYISDPVQRKAAQNLQKDAKNIIRVAEETQPDDAAAIQKFFKQYERYGFSNGDIKYLGGEASDVLLKFGLLSDEKFIKAALSRKNLLKQNNFLGSVTEENKKVFIKFLKDKSIDDEQLESVIHLLSEENAPILKQLLKDKNFNFKLLQDIPATHLRSDNVEVLKQISKNGNVKLQEMLYIMTSTNKSNADIAVQLLKKAGNNTDGVHSILGSVYAVENMSEKGLKAFQLRKKLLSELLDNPKFKLGTDSQGNENYLISRVLSAVSPENYALAKSSILNRNVNLYAVSDFLKGVTLENQHVAKRILDMALKDTRLPDLKSLDAGAAAKYLDEVAKIKNPKIQSQYIEVMNNLRSDKIDEILQIVRTAKPEDAKFASSLVSCITSGLKKEEAESIIKMIEQSGRNLSVREVCNLTVLSHCDEIPVAQFVQRMLSNKSVPDKQLEILTCKYIEIAQKIKDSNFVLPADFVKKCNSGTLKKEEIIRLKEQLFDEFIQKQDEIIKKLPDVFEKLLQNKNLKSYEFEDILFQISMDNIGIIEKYALNPKISKINLAIAKPENISEIEKLADIGLPRKMQSRFLPIIKKSDQYAEKRLEVLQRLLKKEADYSEDDLAKIIYRIDGSTIKYIDEIVQRENLSLHQKGLLLDDISWNSNTENIMKLVRDKSIKGEYFTQILEDTVFDLYEKNPELVKKALDLKVALQVVDPKAKSLFSADFVAITDAIGEKRFANILKGLEEAKTKYNITPRENLVLQITGNANDKFLTFAEYAGGNSLVFKFDKRTGKLITITQPGKSIHIPTGEIVEDVVSKEPKVLSIDVPYRIGTFTKGKNGEFGTVYTESAIKGQYDIFQTRPDGSRIRIGHALITPNGAKHVRKTLTSSDGSKTYLAYREDKKGNTYFHSIIKDKNGQKLSDVKRTFKVISNNHFVSTRDGQAYDIVFTDKKVIVTKLDAAGKKTKEKVEYAIKDVPLLDADKVLSATECLDEKEIYKVAEIFKRYGIEPMTIDRSCVEMLKRLPGDEWFAMSKSCQFVMPQSVLPYNACYGGNSIFLSKELKDNMGVFSHELGHAKFYALNLNKDKELIKIYNAEKKSYTSRFPESRIESIDYFLSRNTAAEKAGLNETVAESNLLTNTIQSWDGIQDRTIFLEQYFPKTIAYLRQKFMELI